MLKSIRALDPEEVRVLGRAYTEAVQALGLTPHPIASCRGTLQYKVAHRIMRLALAGERDFNRLVAAGVEESFSAWAA